MPTFAPLAFLLSAILPFAAQDLPARLRAIGGPPEEAKPDARAFRLQLESVGAKPLVLALRTEPQGLEPFLGLLLAATNAETIRIEGLPPLLLAEAIVASGIGKGAVLSDLGVVNLPFPVWRQRVSIRDGAVEACPLFELPASK